MCGIAATQALDYAWFMTRTLPAVAFILFSMPLLAAETGYRIVHPDGTVEFTDQPAKGAEEIRIEQVPTYQSPSVGTTPSRQASPSPSPRSEAQSGGYESFAIRSPKIDEVLWFTGKGIRVSLQIQPGLGQGDKVVVRLDGEQVAEGRGTSFTVEEVYRGPHTVSAAIVNMQGNVVREAEPVSFFMRQRTILNPNSPLAPSPTPTP